MQAWDGWCNYGIAENPAIKYVVPKEGSDLWVASNILYKVPNRAAMESLEPALVH